MTIHTTTRTDTPPTVGASLLQIADRQARLEEQIRELANIILNFSGKNVLTLDEFCAYIGVSQDFAYNLTHRKSVPFYKPRGGRIYFKKAEIDEWLLQRRMTPIYEIEQQAEQHVKAKRAA